MKIDNVRLGFATNSSSSHSIVVLSEDMRPLGEYGPEEGEYGWQNFVLTTPEAKMAYLAAQVGQNLCNQLGEAVGTLVMRQLFPNVDWNTDWYVDHQSAWYLPLTASDERVNLDFIEDLKEFFDDDSVMILGGNDNEDETYPEYREHTSRTIEKLERDSLGGVLAQKSGDWWTLFNKETGAKVRLSLAQTATPFVRATAPELVDMKITDYCPFGCEFCYQDSTTGGQTGNTEVIKSYLRGLKRLGTFEVTLGGGEPTLHPDFIEIVEYGHNLGLVVNFTTKVAPDKWSSEIIRLIKQNKIGAVGVSIESSNESLQLRAFKDLHLISQKIYAQFVVGPYYGSTLRYVVETCKEEQVPLVLLGYKTNGRGAQAKVYDQEITKELFDKAGTLSVDTSFLDRYSAVLDAAGISDILRVKGEGTVSMYIDAVTDEAAISSYHDMTRIPINAYTLDDAWEELGEYVGNS